MDRRIVIVLSILFLLGGGYALSLFLESRKEVIKEKKKIESVRYVRTKEVRYLDAKSEVHATGRVMSLSEYTLSTEVGGVLQTGTVQLKKGQSFKKGDVLVRIVNDEGVYALKAQKSRFLNTLANLLPDLKIDYDKEYDKWQKFFDSIDINKPLPDLPKENSNREKIFLATRNVLSDYYSIMANEVRLSKFILRAPYNGTFVNVLLEAGSVVNMGARIAQIIKSSALEVEVPMEVEFAKWVNLRDNVELTNNNKTQKWKGVVVRKSNFVDPQSQAISVFVKVNNAKTNELYKGMYMYASFPGVELDEVLEIPRKALFNSNQVFVVENGKLKQQTVNVVKLNETTAYIKGLPISNAVVTEALINAKEGQEVEKLVD